MRLKCVCFHPNCNYLATGSSDRSIRIFDLANLSDNPQVRQYTGHKVNLKLLDMNEIFLFSQLDIFFQFAII